MYESCSQSCYEGGSYSLRSFNHTSMYHMKQKRSFVGIFQLLFEDILIVILFQCSKLEILVLRSGHCNPFLPPIWTQAWGGMLFERNQIPETYSGYRYHWNSTYEMLCQALTLREALDVVCVMDSQLTSLKIGDTHWGILLSLKSFLKKFKPISDCIEGSQ